MGDYIDRNEKSDAGTFRRGTEIVKLIVQIPCYNEAESLPVVIAALPRSLDGVDAIEYLVIDDGSTDGTAQLARTLGVHHIVAHPVNLGLASAFMTGLTESLDRGADVIVNIDADNQYDAADTSQLVHPIVDGRAEMVVGTRPIATMKEFSWLKRGLQRLGSYVVRVVSGTSVEDAPCGFRAFSREAAMRLKVFSRYTYTLETIIQAGHANMRVLSVPVRTNRPLRPSRLVRSTPRYVLKSVATIVRISAVYRPMFFFWTIAALLALGGLVSGSRFLVGWLFGTGSGHVQSVVLAAALMTLAFFAMAIGFLADIVAVNRRLLETLDWRLQRIERLTSERASAPERPDQGRYLERTSARGETAR
jgi:glycosyltransferase involved in cell wall biosynthesis